MLCVYQKLPQTLTSHQWNVYDFVRTIPSGKVTTYKDVSLVVGGSPRSGTPDFICSLCSRTYRLMVQLEMPLGITPSPRTFPATGSLHQTSSSEDSLGNGEPATRQVPVATKN